MRTTKDLIRIAEANCRNEKRVNRNIKQTLMTLYTLIMTMSLFMSVAMAADIETGIKTGLKNVYGVLTSIVVPVAVVSFAFAAYKIFTDGEKGMQQAKTICLYTILGLAIVYLAPVIIVNASDWFKDSGKTAESQVFGTG